MKLSPIGELALQCWKDIPAHFPFVELDEYVIMPNHMHGILILQPNCVPARREFDPLFRKKVDTGDSFSQGMSAISPKAASIPAVVRSYKSVVSRQARLINPYFAWLDRYYDHIIRTSESHERIQNYIRNNQSKWDEDRFR